MGEDQETIAAEAIDPTEEFAAILLSDGRVIDEETGEVLDVEGAPAIDEDIQKVATWVGAKHARIEERIGALNLEKQKMIERIRLHYDAQIAKEEKTRKWIEFRYMGLIRDFVQKTLGATGWKKKSLRYGGSVFGFRTQAEKFEALLTDVDTRKWLWKKSPEALITKVSIDTKLLTDDARALIREGLGPEGIQHIPAEEKFYTR